MLHALSPHGQVGNVLGRERGNGLLWVLLPDGITPLKATREREKKQARNKTTERGRRKRRRTRRKKKFSQLPLSTLNKIPIISLHT